MDLKYGLAGSVLVFATSWASAQTPPASVKLTTDALGLGSSDINDGSTVDADVAGKIVTSPTTGTGSILTVQKSGLAGPGSLSDPLLVTITAETHLDNTGGPSPSDWHAGVIYLSDEATAVPDGRDEGLGVRAFTVHTTTGLRTFSGGLAKIEGSKEVSGGTDPVPAWVAGSSGNNGAPHVDESARFDFNPALAVVAANTGVLLSKFESGDKIDLTVKLASGVVLTQSFVGTSNTAIFSLPAGARVGDNLWCVRIDGMNGIAPNDLVDWFEIRAVDDNPSSPQGTAEHFLITGLKYSEATTCVAGGVVLGTPCLGATVKMVMTGAPGCFGCFIVALTPGPTEFAGVSYPIGFPFFPFISGVLPSGSQISLDVTLPNDPAFINFTVYGLVFLLNPDGTQISTSGSIPLTIISCP